MAFHLSISLVFNVSSSSWKFLMLGVFLHGLIFYHFILSALQFFHFFTILCVWCILLYVVSQISLWLIFAITESSCYVEHIFWEKVSVHSSHIFIDIILFVLIWHCWFFPWFFHLFLSYVHNVCFHISYLQATVLAINKAG